MSIAMAIRGYMGINRPSPVPPMGLNGTWPGIAKKEKKNGRPRKDENSTNSYHFFSFSRGPFSYSFQGFWAADEIGKKMAKLHNS